MSEVMIPKEKMDYTIDLLITMIVEELAEETGRDSKEILIDFLSSKTGKALYDAENRLWCNGPSYIVDLYIEEIQGGEYKRTESYSVGRGCPDNSR